MPELPDVEIFRRYLARTSLHRRIQKVEVKDSGILAGVSGRQLSRILRGRELGNTRRHGKHLFASCNGTWLELHFGMTGRLEAGREGEDSLPEYTRFVLHFEDDTFLACEDRRKLGHVGLVEDPDAFIEEKGLGPDALDLSWTEFDELISGSRGSVKSVLMNQEALAGIGNIYSDEILFQGRIDPAARVSDLDRDERRRLYREMRKVLEKAIERRADPARFPRSWLIPHREAGEACPRCDTKIRKRKAAVRGFFVCPRCQSR